MLKELLEYLIRKPRVLHMLVFFAVIFGIIILFLLAGPAFTGYTIYKDLQRFNYSFTDYTETIQEREADLTIAQTEFSACAVENKRLSAGMEDFVTRLSDAKTELSTAKTDFSLCNSENARLSSGLEDFVDELASCSEDLAEEKTSREKVQNECGQRIEDLLAKLEQQEAGSSTWKVKYDLLGQNTANNICCKQRVDNPAIKAYILDNNRIVCLESGALNITC